MPLYEFRCRTCDAVFTEQRPMSRSGDDATCPDGHDGARRLLSVFAATGRSSAAPSSPAAAPATGGFGGGGCGAGCGCAH